MGVTHKGVVATGAQMKPTHFSVVRIEKVYPKDQNSERSLMFRHHKRSLSRLINQKPDNMGTVEMNAGSLCKCR